jgi:protocatechuate 3,4-dioxygenase beta subunit
VRTAESPPRRPRRRRRLVRHDLRVDEEVRRKLSRRLRERWVREQHGDRENAEGTAAHGGLLEVAVPGTGTVTIASPGLLPDWYGIGSTMAAHRTAARTLVERGAGGRPRMERLSGGIMHSLRHEDQHDDDAPVGRVLSRREVVRLLALSGAAVATGCGRGGTTDTAAAAAGTTSQAAANATSATLPACVVKPELTVGPYFVDKQLDRSDIRVEPSTGKPVEGVPLALTFNVSRIDGGACTPLAGAMVDLWHCDARGVYSAVNDSMSDSSKEKFCRGYQVTDAKGVARFTTIYPGWYRGRTVHIHFKIRTPVAAALADRTADTWEFTSQLFFDESLSNRIFASAPYVSAGARDTLNATDGIFRDSGGQLMLAVAPVASGYAAAFDIGLDLSNAQTGKPERSGGPDGFGPPGGRGAPRGSPAPNG